MTSGWFLLATIGAWVIAVLCVGLCAIALWLRETDLTIRRGLPEMGYNAILELREDAWLQFRAPLAWALSALSVGAAATACIPALLVRKLVAWIPAAIAAVVSLGTLGYLIGTR